MNSDQSLPKITAVCNLMARASSPAWIVGTLGPTCTTPGGTGMLSMGHHSFLSVNIATSNALLKMLWVVIWVDTIGEWNDHTTSKTSMALFWTCNLSSNLCFQKITARLRQMDRATILVWTVVSPGQLSMLSRGTGMQSMGHLLFLSVHIATRNVPQRMPWLVTLVGIIEDKNKTNIPHV